jgi:branched-subunit amino acid ABC-type transport system permease component
MQLDYTTSDLARSGNIIIIPGVHNPITMGLPPFLLDIIAFFIAIIGTWYVIKKTDIGKIMRAVYEKG